MKKTYLALVAAAAFCNVSSAQNDTIYFMKNGLIVNQQSIKPDDVDSAIFYQPFMPPGNIFPDSRDGNIYQTVTIDQQVWMAENLRYLPSVEGPVTGSATTPYYYVFDYFGTDVNEAKATSNYATYGVLYNWTAAMAISASSSANPSGVQGVCPTGWHLPSDAEYATLITFLGGEFVAGGKLKETGTTHWTSPNNGAFNEVGFTALPGGSRSTEKIFSYIGINGYWWSTTEQDTNYAWHMDLGNHHSMAYMSSNKKEWGFSVRCVRN
jgi:uncharacterized protein (TIGR02145 family)